MKKREWPQKNCVICDKAFQTDKDTIKRQTCGGKACKSKLHTLAWRDNGHWRWKGGSRSHWYRRSNEAMREAGLDAICSTCGKTDGVIDVHHKDKNKQNNDIINLAYMCRSCHRKLHDSKKTA